jgi:hypothetical protein
MELITLEVDDAVGKVHRSFSTKSKQQFNQVVSLMVKKAVNDATFADYTKFLDDAGNEAVRNGLTPEILKGLLSSND